MGVVSFSVIIPCYNEAENIEPLARELVEAMKSLDSAFEIIYVDDGSTDDSALRIGDLQMQIPELRLVRHKGNFGQSAAFLSGFEQAKGEILITLDADMQNDPHDIPRMLEELRICDMVCGVRAKRRDHLMKRLSSRIANKVRKFILKDDIQDAGCSFRAFHRRALQNLIAFKGLHRFFPTICEIHGFRIVQIPVNHRPRYKGTTKYGITNRLFVGIHDL
ncbi:glycosyltransferase family 2 protein, partial [Candidatus Sumerlaeota bacterium]|nr:glycosyltransferase family 2 protein [Candidatus Sumerlaeota bacterium]